MNDLHNLPLEDGIIRKILLIDNRAEIDIFMYNGKKAILRFMECWRLIDKQSIDKEIGGWEIIVKSELINEVASYLMDCGGTSNELGNAKHIMFYEAWNNDIMLEIVYNYLQIELK